MSKYFQPVLSQRKKIMPQQLNTRREKLNSLAEENPLRYSINCINEKSPLRSAKTGTRNLTTIEQFNPITSGKKQQAKTTGIKTKIAETQHLRQSTMFCDSD